MQLQMKQCGHIETKPEKRDQGGNPKILYLFVLFAHVVSQVVIAVRYWCGMVFHDVIMDSEQPKGCSSPASAGLTNNLLYKCHEAL